MRLTPLVDNVAADLREAGLDIQRGTDPSVVSLQASTRAGPWTTYVWTREADSQVVVHGVVPWPVPDSSRGPVSRYLTLANYGLLMGNFEMDLSDGEVRFKTSLDFEGCELEVRLVRNLIAANLRALERYLPGLVAVVNGGDPEAAVAAVEGSPEASTTRSRSTPTPPVDSAASAPEKPTRRRRG
jgi:hypothetical protein